MSYLGRDVVVGRWAHDGEADEEHVRLGVRQGPETIIILLACSVPKSQTDRLAIHNYTSRVVVKPAKIWSQQPQVASKCLTCICISKRGGTDTVGMYSPGNALVVYEMSRHV